MTDAVQRWTALAVAAIVLVTSIIGVAVRDDDEVVALASPSPSGTAATKRPKATAKPPAATARATMSVPPGTTAATQAPTRTFRAPSRTTGGVTQPKAGTYTYKKTSDGETSNEGFEVADTGRDKQRETEEGVASDVVWKPNGKYLASSDFGAFDCDWNPDILELELPLKVGSTWSVRGSCSPGGGATITFTGSVRVVEQVERPVGSQQVETYHLKASATVDFKTPQGNFKQTGTSDDYFAPSAGLYVYSVEKTSGDDPMTGQPNRTTTTRQLVSLNPS